MRRNTHLSTVIGTWFGVGLSPKAAGTAGSLAALPFAWVIQQQAGSMALWIAAFLLFAIGWWATADYVARTQRDDPSEMVVDEVVGQWLVLAFMPHSLFGYGLGFLLFRFFDVLKPWPISFADRTLHGGLGVMFDDVLAAIAGIMVFQLMTTYYPALSSL
jgi:phosphatidylglycerophosphatase A